MPKILLFLCPLVLFLSQSCRLSTSKEALPQQTAEFFVRYLQPEKEYKVEAVLWEGDSLPLAKSIRFPEGIRFADKDLGETQVADNLLRYSAEFGGDFEANAAFKFRDKRGTLQTIAPIMQPLEGISLSFPKQLEGQVSLDISSGGVLHPSESIVLVLTDRSGQTSTVTIEGPSNSGNYTLPLVSFGNPVRGEAELYLVKKQVRNESKGSLQVHLTEEVYGEVLRVRVP
jgi:hypothetical protein